MRDDTAIIVPWHNPDQFRKFCKEWELNFEQLAFGPFERKDYIYAVQDKDKQGCARTKNRGLDMAVRDGAKYAVVIDDDCFPVTPAPYDDCFPVTPKPYADIWEFAEKHVTALAIPETRIGSQGTSADGHVRGEPYMETSLEYDSVFSMGWWEGVPDLDAVHQLTEAYKVAGLAEPIRWPRRGLRAEFTAISGMNICFDLKCYPFCRFVPVDRFDDIWAGWMLQQWASAHCLSGTLSGPPVYHSRQSNVWANLRAEAKWLELNETLWKIIAKLPPYYTGSPRQDAIMMVQHLMPQIPEELHGPFMEWCLWNEG